MDNPTYISLSRQSGLLKELSVIANNMANSDTIGFKREGAVFTEFINGARGSTAAEGARHSLSMGRLGAHFSEFTHGELRQTSGELDVAIDGEGFFMVESPGGERLTRAGHFQANAEGILVTPDGMPVLDQAGGQIQIPQEINRLAIGGDGTISGDGVELAKLGVVTADPTTMSRDGGNLWVARNGTEIVEEPRILQGFVEDSNVQPVAEIARMIEVQRYYDAGQKLLEMEDERIRQVITTTRQIG